MSNLGRRDFITLWLQALLLTLFPWLRTERGIEAAGRAADAMVRDDLREALEAIEQQGGPVTEVQINAIDLRALTSILKQRFPAERIYAEAFGARAVPRW